MSAPQPKAAAFRFSNFEPATGEDNEIMCEIWLADVCAAAWCPRETQKLASFIVAVLSGVRPGDVYLRDIESALNIQPEETNRSLKLMKNFGTIADYAIDKGRLSLQARVGFLQRIRMLEARNRYRELLGTETDRVATEAVGLLKSITACNEAGEAGEELGVGAIEAGNLALKQ